MSPVGPHQVLTPVYSFNLSLSNSVTLLSSVYLYGEAARQEKRRSLPAIRVGEYEALPEKVLFSSDNGTLGLIIHVFTSKLLILIIPSVCDPVET